MVVRKILQVVTAIVFLASVSGCVHVDGASRLEDQSQQIPARISLDGDWLFVPAAAAPQEPYRRSEPEGGWSAATVPGNWYLAGHDLAGAAFYKRTFSIGALPDDAIARVVFEAVDYAADVWVNEVWIGRHQGYFDSFSFDITAHLDEEADNDITVRVDSPIEQPEDWSLNKRLIKGVLSHHDTRPGGAWSDTGQDANTGGIWGSVALDVSRKVAIDRIDWRDSVDQRSSTATTTARIVLAAPIDEATKLSVELVEHHRQTGASKHFKRSLTAKVGESELAIDLGKRAVELWSPWEQGTPHLYDYDITLSRNGTALATYSMTRGIRTVRRDAQTGEWSVNGRRIFLRGTNYIPSQWLSEMTSARFRRDIELMRQANINAVRVHAMVLPQRFYDLANEAGLLVWQDFPLQWGYSDDPVFHAEAARQLRRMIEQFGHHPSIFAWSMHNEPPWEASWMQYKYPQYDANQNRELDRMLADTARSLDGTRHIHEASLTAEHPWFGWYSGSWKDYAKPTKESLITEFGAQALPSLDVLSGIFAAKQLTPDAAGKTEPWRYRNFQQRETFEIAKVERGETVADLVTNTQAYQARLVKFAAETYRRSRYSPVAAIFQFMFVESWPSVNWGVLDYQRTPKPGFDAMRTAYQPVLPSVEFKDDRFVTGKTIDLGVWVVNDLHKQFENASLETALWRSGQLVHQKMDRLDVNPDSAAHVASWKRSDLSAGEYVLRLRLTQNDGQLLGTNQFSFRVERARQKGNAD